MEETLLLLVAVLAVAVLYSAVGHAGASGYIATMALFGMAPEQIRPTALFLNILVASIATWHFWGAGHFRWSLFWPYAVLAVPCAFIGGALQLPPGIFNGLVGCVLLFSAWRFFARPSADEAGRPPPVVLGLVIGAGLGLLSGLTGTGGGIFLTPLLLAAGWARAKEAAAVSALFILLNSTAGLLGNLQTTGGLPPIALQLAIVALAGGASGSWLGSRRFDPRTIKRLLAAVLLIAGLKLLFF